MKCDSNKKGNQTFIIQLFFFFFALKFSMLQKLGIEPSTDHYYQVSLASGFSSNAYLPTGGARPRPAVTSAVSYALLSKNPNQPFPLGYYVSK